MLAPKSLSTKLHSRLPGRAASAASFRCTGSDPWGLAGLWNQWIDRETGEVHESYTMLTINADAHPLMRRMHKPAPKLPADQQDKRSVIPIERGDVDLWLAGTMEDASKLLKLAPASVFAAGPPK